MANTRSPLLDSNNQIIDFCEYNAFSGSNPSGRLSFTTGNQMFGNNTNGTILDWRNIHSVISPDCLTTNLKLNIDFGDVITYGRRCRIYLWFDWRIRFNGQVTVTRSSQRYHYIDYRNDTNPNIVQPLQYNLIASGSTEWNRPNINPNTNLEVEIRMRGRMAAAQTSSWARVYGPYRAQSNITLLPQKFMI